MMRTPADDIDNACEDFLYAHGLPCAALRHRGGGHWCGYVGVPRSHPLSGIMYWSDKSTLGRAPENMLDVHGLLTHSGDLPNLGYAALVRWPCVWWFGFDCNHAKDMSPRSDHAAWAIGMEAVSQYRDLTYVRRELVRLAEQLAALTIEGDDDA